ncbi:TBC1 domain family member 24-like isoform X2 [Cololabis saira]|uniref:TBC1 domain family member 24-like isoform X2 n=1 Tax=Cololabis saira TaxID=129043 RepID=UPI002AD486C6|nr:TBC1 domain family member 24-like isoform X2 [Cololabis saira]
MIDVSATPRFSICGNLDPPKDQDLSSTATSIRQRSHSYYSKEDSKETPARPRSRSFYSYETSELYSHFSSLSSPLRQRPSSTLKTLQSKKEDRDGGKAGLPGSFKRPKSKGNRHLLSRELNGAKGTVSMMTISESDSWEICSCSGMKYGQFVEWEKIDPEAAMRYQQILKSGHQQLKTMARRGLWAVPHTLRAKAYYHIIHSINSRAGPPGRDVYLELAKTLFGDQKMSSHPVPEYMEDGDIPRYCLNKAGLNSVKKILLCLSKYFPEMSFCPVLPALVSLVLHFSEDEAECFYSISRLVCYVDANKRYVDQTFLTYRASCMTFGDLANRCCRGIRKLIAGSHQNLFEFYSDWIMWIFADLPFTYAIRVLDVYLLEGYKVLYRVALALLGLYKASVSSRVAHVEDFRADMKSFVQSVDRHCTVEELLERAFGVPMATRAELNLLFNANKESLVRKGVSKQQKRQTVETVDFNVLRSSVFTGTEMRVIWAWIPERFALFSPVRLFSTSEHGRSLASFYSHLEGHEPVVLIIKTEDEEVCGAFLSTDVIKRRTCDSQGLAYFGTGECFVFTLRPSMERYQRAMVNIMTRRASPGPVQPSKAASAPESRGVSQTEITTLTCPAETPRDPRDPRDHRDHRDPGYLTGPVSAPLDDSMTAKEPKRPKEQQFSMFIAGDDSRLVIGGDGGHALCLQPDLEGGNTEPCDTFRSSPLCKGRFQIQSLEVWGIQQSICCFPPK